MNKKLVYGWGINDIKGSYEEKYKKVWKGMIQRCYSEPYLIKYPTYRNINIIEEWKYLSIFRDWFLDNYIEGYVLDKDLYRPNTKVYSISSCLFIPTKVNNLLVKQKGKGYSKIPSGKYRAMMSIDGKNIVIGTYNTKQEVHKAYIKFKANYWLDIADTYINTDEKIWIGLYRQAEHLIGNDWTQLPY